MNAQVKSGAAGPVPPFVWKVACGLAVVVVAYALMSGSSVKRVWTPGGGGMEFERNSPLVPPDEMDRVSTKDLSDNQKRLKEELNSSLEQLPPPTSRLTQVDISGLWGSPYGVSYNVNQSGNYVVVQEISPLYGITAVGQGTINGSTIQLSYTTAIGTVGQASL